MDRPTYVTLNLAVKKKRSSTAECVKKPPNACDRADVTCD